MRIVAKLERKGVSLIPIQAHHTSLFVIASTAKQSTPIIVAASLCYPCFLLPTCYNLFTGLLRYARKDDMSEAP